ncbi:MAG: 1-acyl-sn-glycerol-3-phosphate acyltransferase [Verrucomicrobiales bacterium]
MKSIARLFFRVLFAPLVMLVYRVRRTGEDRMPATGGVLLLSNHVSYIDSFIMYVACPRPVRFVVLENYVKNPAIGWFLKLFGGIPIRPSNAREAINRTVEALEEGTVVCLFPEGELTRLGVTTQFKKGFEIIARRSGCDVVPAYMDGLWGSIFSFERDRFFKKWPRRLTCPLQVAFGEPIPAAEATTETVRRAIWEVSVEAFATRRELESPLEVALVKGLKRNRRRSFMVEYGKNGRREWSRANTLGLATAMARHWMKHPHEPEDRIGVLLPPGPMPAVINLGLFLAGKSPVNLPFTIDAAETEAIADTIADLGIRTVITSRAFMPHLVDFWRGDEGVFIDLKSVLSLPGKGMTLLERMRAFAEPAWLACWRLDLNKRDRTREAVVMVPGPEEKPIVLNSLDLFKNSLQVISANFVQRDEIVFSDDSLCRPSGLALACWSPMLGTGKVVSRSLSLQGDLSTLEQAVREEGVTLIAGQSEFFSNVASPLGAESLKYGVVFGSANPEEIEAWEEAAGIPLARALACRGRVVAMSRTDPNPANLGVHAPQQGRDPNAVGRPLPGIAVKTEEGRLWLKFDPPWEDGGSWVEGPPDAEITPEGFVVIREGDPA